MTTVKPMKTTARRLVAGLLAAGLALAPSAALADPLDAEAPAEETASSAAPAVEAPPAPDPLGPDARQALDHLAAGRFAEAVAAFRGLAGSADPTTRAWAAHLAALSQRWLDDGVQLTPGVADIAEEATARAERRRTTGEMAVLYIDGVLYGLGSGGYVAVLTEADSLTAIILPCLGLAGVTAGGLYLYDSRNRLGYGVPRSISAGLRLGLLDGALWTLWNEETGSDWGAKTAVSVVWAATTLGGVAGGLIGEYVGATPGAASMVESAGLWGAALGGMWTFAVTEQLDGVDSEAAWLLSAAISVNVAAATGALIAAEFEPSTSRVRYLDLGGLSGGVLVGGLYLAFADRDVEGSVLAATTGLGIAAGLGTAWWFTRDMDREPFLDDPLDAQLSIVPTPDGAMLGLSGRF